MSYIAGKSRLSRYLEETEEDPNLREKNLITEFGDGEDNNELIDEVQKRYESPFKDFLFKDAWLRRLSSGRSLNKFSPSCVLKCAEYSICILLPESLLHHCSKRGCSCNV